ncbi:MAG: serine/threonine-protein kinase, partial [Gemmatimonadaceae bacterium]
MPEQFRAQLQDALAPAFTIEREITGGGMSRVFVALEHALGRTVVVKVLRPDLAAGMNRDRFRREIMLAAQLHHPHIVPLLSAGERGDLIWYTMPFVEGESLREALAARGKFSPREVVRVLQHVLDALAYAHQRGVIHRDIKPGNILTHGAHALVTDFGVAKALSAAMPHSGATSAGLAIGTPAYMAPEQLAADPTADHRMDLYAAGLLAYELLTAEQPFSESSPAATMAAQLTRMPQPIEGLRPDVPGPLADLIMRLLAKQPNERPATARVALDELEELITPQSGVLAPSAATTARRPAPNAVSEPTATTQPRRRRGLPWLVAAGTLIVVAASALVLARRDQGERTRQDVAARAAAIRAESLRVAAESAAIKAVPPPAVPNDTPRRVRSLSAAKTASSARDSAPAAARPAPRST